MNPALMLQGISAVTGIVGSMIPDKTITDHKVIQNEASQNIGRASGVLGPTTTEFDVTRKESPLSKKILQGISTGTGIASNLTGIFGGNRVQKPESPSKDILSSFFDGKSLSEKIPGLYENITNEIINMPVLPDELPVNEFIPSVVNNLKLSSNKTSWL